MDRMGLRVVLADINEEGLRLASKQVADIGGEANVVTVVTDVSKIEDVKKLKDRAYDAFGEVAIFFFFAFFAPNHRLSVIVCRLSAIGY